MTKSRESVSMAGTQVRFIVKSDGASKSVEPKACQLVETTCNETPTHR